MGKDRKDISIDFIRTLENRQSADELIPFYHPDIEQVEYPNSLVKSTALRNLDKLLEGAQKGKMVLQKEEYDIQKIYSFGNTVILEATWTGTLAIPLGNLPVGGKMKAHFAQFYEFKDDKIIRQRNYDCFEAF